MNTGQQCADGTGTPLGNELNLGLKNSGGEDGALKAPMSTEDVIYRVATVSAVLYLLASVF